MISALNAEIAGCTFSKHENGPPFLCGGAGEIRTQCGAAERTRAPCPKGSLLSHSPTTTAAVSANLSCALSGEPGAWRLHTDPTNGRHCTAPRQNERLALTSY